MTPDSPRQNHLVEKVWNLRWSDYFPREIEESIQVDYVDYQRFQSFNEKNFSKIYTHNEESRFRIIEESSSRDAYLETIGDFFLITTTDGEEVGMATGSILDWTSYNFRNIAILPEFQSRGVYYSFFKTLVEILKQHKVQKIEGDVSPTNKRHLHLLNKMGYTITSMQLSERWGALLHVTLYLEESMEHKFGKLYSCTYGSDFENRDNEKTSKTKP